MSKPNFTLNSQTIGFTFPQSKLTEDQLNAWIDTIFSDYSIKYTCIATETHKDGGRHFHVAIKLGKPFYTRDARFGDLFGEHPNVLRPRNFRNWVEYCKKDGSYKEKGSIEPRRTGTNVSEETVVDKATILSKLDFLIWAGVNRVTYAEKIWDLAHKTDHVTIDEKSLIKGVMVPQLEAFNFSLDWLGPKALILIGDSGCGKTTWAKTHGPKPCLFVTHIDDLKLFRAGYHQSILFDDVSFTHYPIQAQIHLVDFFDVRSIHIRYGIVTIPSNTIKIFTCNENPVTLSHPAIARRCKVVRVNTKGLDMY